ncbi:glycoside hydrolase family 13 protein [Meredithblackwellia eburnea MCA 4105]
MTKNEWKNAVFYQIYPASFCDSNGDGIGDLPGICSKLSILKNLRVDYIWLTPVYASPEVDSGYDIESYTRIHRAFGTMHDWEDLLKDIHGLGMKLIMDLVVNHTSSQHEWFLNSKSSKLSPKRDYYIWRPPRFTSQGERLPPNNWMTMFRSGSAWEWDETTGEYYLHLFSKEQPDLNWENPRVREEVHDVMRFWLDKGIDGFRMDVINCISKKSGLPDSPRILDGFLQPPEHCVVNGPRVHEYLREMNEQVLSHYRVVTVGECPATPDSVLLSYVKSKPKELDMVFTFALNDIDEGPEGPMSLKSWTLPQFKSVIATEQANIHESGGWNSVAIESHDQPRSVSRFGNDSPRYRARSAKLLALLHVSQSGTIFIYQGQDFGQVNMPHDWPIEEYKDVRTKLDWREAIKKKEDMNEFMEVVQAKARDHARTPMQWNSSANGGFTTGIPWMRVHEDSVSWNVQTQMEDPDSVWSFWRRLLKMRKQEPVLAHGTFDVLDEANDNVFAILRSLEGHASIIVILNFSSKHQYFRAGRFLGISDVEFMIGTRADGRVSEDSRTFSLGGWEGVMWRILDSTM